MTPRLETRRMWLKEIHAKVPTRSSIAGCRKRKYPGICIGKQVKDRGSRAFVEYESGNIEEKRKNNEL